MRIVGLAMLVATSEQWRFIHIYQICTQNQNHKLTFRFAQQ